MKQPCCKDCICWEKLIDIDGGIGICDNTKSDHNQHLIGYAHQICEHIIERSPYEEF